MALSDADDGVVDITTVILLAVAAWFWVTALLYVGGMIAYGIELVRRPNVHDPLFGWRMLK